jgi:serine/threonine protein kinase
MSENLFPMASGQLLHNRYQILKELGRNAGRRTLLAKDVQTQELVVIKFLLFNNDFRWEDLKLFEREAETLKSLSFPRIPCYLDYFELDAPNLQGFALVQTYIDAQSLQEYLKAGRTFSETEVKQLAKSLLELLNYLHSHQAPVIHRDIKPSNILLANRSAHNVGDIYLVDFGSVQTTNRQDGTITIVGTYGYMPPEQFGGKAFPASDIYSLGATLIYLATGTEPAELPQEDFQIQFESIANLSSEFVAWLQLMTHPNLKKRFTSAQAALQALESGNLSQIPTQSRVVRHPISSRFVVTKNPDNLNITISYTPSVNPDKSIAKIANTTGYKKMWWSHIFLWLSLAKLWKWIMKIIQVLFFIALSGMLFYLVFVNFYYYPFPTVCFILFMIGFPVLAINQGHKIGIENFLNSICANGIPRLVKIIKSIDYLNIKINQQVISLSFTYTSKSKTQENYPIFQQPRDKISQLIFHRKSYQIVETHTDRGSKRTKEQELPPQLFISVDDKRYNLSYQLTPPELYWLAEELSDFLGIPITKE